ncbi:MAG: lysophospholipase [Lachnospiraceae bacterium]|nr:lysophospholipase [Lachnospiraceae bacterium]
MKEYYNFNSSDQEQTKIHGVKWTPEGEPVGVIQLVHGMIEYIERYDEFAEFMNAQGFVVMGHDHIAHGDSVKSKDDWGIMHTDTPSETMVEDMFTNYKIIKEQYPSLPYFILGHSMGSYLLRHMLILKAADFKDVKGAIIMGSGTTPENMAKMGMTALKVLKTFKGWDGKSKIAVNLMYGESYKGFSTDGSEPEKSWLSTNVESVKKYYSDPKDTFMFSLNGYRLLVNSSGFVSKLENVEKMNKDIPLLFVSGAQDPVGDLSVGVQTAYDTYKKAGVKDVSLHLFEGMRHEILQEVERQKVFEYIYSWISEKM